MNSSELTLSDVGMLHEVFRGFRSHEGFGYWFRGQSDSSWHLLPKAGRSEFRLSGNRDLGRFRSWCTKAIAYSSLPECEMEKLAIAQHHGLATRLLDWTENPLVACYFASWECPESEGAVYMFEAPRQFLTDNMKLESLEEANGVFGYLPNAIAPRVLNQKALFSVHCDASTPIQISPSQMDTTRPNLTRLKIPAELKLEVLRLVEDYGVDNSFLFPDLDGLSGLMNRRTARMKKDV